MSILSIITAALFLLSAVLNLGERIPLGFVLLSFTNPSSSIAVFEIIIGALLLVSAAVSRAYVFGGAYVLALVGIAFGVTTKSVVGLAHNLHLLMAPFDLIGILLLGIETYSVYQSRTDKTPKALNRELILILQFFNAGLVILGGAAYAATGTFPAGTILGLFHLAVGFAALYTGYAFLKSKDLARSLLIWVNLVTILYSAFSEILGQIYSLLTPGLNDSAYGTVIAIIISGTTICIVLLRPLFPKVPEKIIPQNKAHSA
jgi:hypothetical protein